MTSASTFPQRLTKIDDLTRPDHWYLEPEDDCYFFGEYTARRGYAFSPTNNLVLNFKKSVTTRGTPQWYYKEQAVQQAAAAFRAALDDRDLDGMTFVPIPPSKAKTDPLYDDRLTQMLRTIRPARPLDIRELILQTRSTEPAHGSETRPTPADLEALYEIDPTLIAPPPREIAIVDDILTTGAHFRAVKACLGRAFPEIRIIGLFLARRVPETVDPVDLEGWEQV